MWLSSIHVLDNKSMPKTNIYRNLPQMNAKSHSETNISSTISMASSQLVLIIFLLLALAIPLTIAYDNVPIKSVEKTAQVVVEGMVYCQSCDNYGSWSLSGAKPIAEAKVSVISILEIQWHRKHFIYLIHSLLCAHSFLKQVIIPF